MKTMITQRLTHDPTFIVLEWQFAEENKSAQLLLPDLPEERSEQSPIVSLYGYIAKEELLTIAEFVEANYPPAPPARSPESLLAFERHPWEGADGRETLLDVVTEPFGHRTEFVGYTVGRDLVLVDGMYSSTGLIAIASQMIG